MLLSHSPTLYIHFRDSGQPKSCVCVQRPQMYRKFVIFFSNIVLHQVRTYVYGGPDIEIIDYTGSGLIAW